MILIDSDADRRVAGGWPYRVAIGSAAICLLALTRTGWAQQAPQLGYAYPPAVQGGTTTAVQLGGYDFTSDLQLLVSDPQATLTMTGPPGDFLVPGPPYWFGEKGRSTAFPIARELPATITVPGVDGPRWLRWQVANANGSSSSAVIYISDRREVVEERRRDQPQTLAPLPIGVSGRLETIAQVDRYRIQALRDGPLTVELFARRLGANFHGVLTVHDDQGRLLVDSADTEGIDTAVSFAATSQQHYVVGVHDIDFRGNRAFVYRLAVTAGPRVLATIPAAIPRGETLDVRFIGIGVATGKIELESTTRTLSIPADTPQSSLHYTLLTPRGAAPGIEIPLSRLSEQTNWPPQTETELAGPCGVSSRFASTDPHSYRWQASQGQVWNLAAMSRAIGTRLDLSISIHDAAGKQLAANDDLAGTADAGLQFTAPADGTYDCRVQDVSGRPVDAAAVYRLALERRMPSFELSIPPQLQLAAGGKVDLAIKATRHGGFAGEIQIEVHGLPAGVSVPDDLQIAGGKNDLQIAVQADQRAASVAGKIRVVGRGSVNGQTLERTAEAPATGNLCPRDPAAQRQPHAVLAVTLPPRFRVELVDKNRQRAVHRGTTYPAPFLIHRDAGFDGPIELQMAARQGRHRQGIRGPVMTVPPAADRALYPCFLPQWLETDRTTRMVVLGVAQQPDAAGNLRSVTRLADARVTMILEGALLSVAHQAAELTVRGGQTFAVEVEVSRSPKLVEPVTIDLQVPDELKGLVTCRPVPLGDGQSRGLLSITTTADPAALGRWDLQVRGRALQAGRWPLIAESELTVQITD